MVEQAQRDPFNSKERQATILVVDDSVASAKLLDIQLGQAGYRVILTYDGEQALATVKTEMPDLVILDVMMPGLDGFSVCRSLKSDKQTQFTPVIMLTALDQVRDRIEGLRAGADDFLSKPFNREELLARVRSLLRLRFAYQALQTERNHLALLYDISQELNRSLDSDQVLDKIVVRTREALQASMCSLLLLGESQAAVRQIISRQGQPLAVMPTVAPEIMTHGLAGWVLQHREATIVVDAAQDDRWLILPDDQEPVASVAAAPLGVGEEIIGVLLVTHTRPGFFDDGHLTVLTSIAAQAAITVRNARLYEREQQQRRQLELLQSAGIALSAELNRDALLYLIVRQGTTLLNASAASLMLLDEDQRSLTVEAWHGLPERYAREERVPVSQVWSLLTDGRRSFQIHDISQASFGRADLARREGLVSQLSLALVASGRFLGLLNLYSREEARPFGPDEIKLAETFGQQAAVALANAELLAQALEERGKLSAVLSSTTDAVLVVDERGNLILANPAAAQTFGLHLVEQQGQPLAGQVPEALLSIFQRVAATNEPESAEIAVAQDKALYVSVAPVGGVGQVAVVQDITPLKELEAMRLEAEREERRHLRQVFERYVAPELVDRILAQEAGLLERRERRDVVVLFTDLRGFTRLTATVPAHSVIEILNEFFTAAVEVVYAHQGTVFDLAGDELMVGFGAPFDQEDAARRALATAGDIQKGFAILRQRWQEEQGVEVGLGIGIDRGQVAMGSIGAPRQMNYGMVGNAVNTAHHLVEMAQHGEIIVTEAVVESLNGQLGGWNLQPLPAVRLKGKGAPVRIYRAEMAE